MRVAAACQLSLPVGQAGGPAGRWAQLPEEARAQVLVLLARLIARGVLIDADTDGDAGDATGGEASRVGVGRG